MGKKILVIDDEREVGTFFRHLLKEKYEVTVVNSSREAMAAIEESVFDLALVDLKLPDGDGIALLRAIKEKNPGSEVIIMTGYSTVNTAVEAIKLGAFDYIEKPFEEIEALEKLIEEALAKSGLEHESELLAGFLVAKSPKMRSLASTAARIAGHDVTVVIEGETGSGKEVLARYIHCLSKRSHHPFIAVNCGAVAETLLESELFGHEKGAFTGAVSSRRGIFEIADKGTLLLDEVTEASPALQVKLLRVLETREARRVGGETSYRFDVRIIATTNVSLAEAVAAKRFREDLFFRLNSIVLSVPPLRERKEDIPALCDFFLRQQMGENKIIVSREVMDIFMEYPWPGNVRELFNTLSRVAVMAEEKIILPRHLPERIRKRSMAKIPVAAACADQNVPIRDDLNGCDIAKAMKQAVMGIASRDDFFACMEFPEVVKVLNEAKDEIIRDIIIMAIERAGGDRREACKILRLNPRQLKYYLNEKLGV